MTNEATTTWGGSLHQTFRLQPTERQAPNLRHFLMADGLTEKELLDTLPFDRKRSKKESDSTTTEKQKPDPKRYRDGRQIYQTVGLLYEGDDKVIHVTDLGVTVLRWLNIINENNRSILMRHAAYTLAACQLRNPTGSGKKYENDVEVFPFAFIWRAMLSLDHGISSDELNRCLFTVTNENALTKAIDRIRQARAAKDISILGPETISGKSKNDRIIPWMAMASFGWVLFPDKGSGKLYRLDPGTLPIVKEAASIHHKHRDFSSVADYILHIVRCAALPKDLR